MQEGLGLALPLAVSVDCAETDPERPAARQPEAVTLPPSLHLQTLSIPGWTYSSNHTQHLQKLQKGEAGSGASPLLPPLPTWPHRTAGQGASSELSWLKVTWSLHLPMGRLRPTEKQRVPRDRGPGPQPRTCSVILPGPL